MVLDTITLICLLLLALALTFVTIRMVRGPSPPDRVISQDLASVIGVATIGVYCVRHNRSEPLDVAMVIAIVAFLSTVAFSRYFEKRALSD